MLLIFTFVTPSIAFATRSLLLHSKVRQCQGTHPTHGNRIFEAFFVADLNTISILFAKCQNRFSIFSCKTFLSALCSIFCKRLFSEKVFKHQLIANVVFYKNIIK